MLIVFNNYNKTKTKTETVYWNIKTTLMSSTQCKNTKSEEHVNEHTTGRNILKENYHTQQENADSIKLQINLVSDILLGFISQRFIIVICKGKLFMTFNFIFSLSSPMFRI